MSGLEGSNQEGLWLAWAGTDTKYSAHRAKTTARSAGRAAGGHKLALTVSILTIGTTALHLALCLTVG